MKVELVGGQVALVDDADADLVAGRRWRFLARRDKSGKGYAWSPEHGHAVLMHRLILGLPPRKPVVDHINGDGLDNRRQNLRTGTQSQNRGNTTLHPHSSRFKGVSYDNQTSSTKKWKVQIKVNGRTIWLGRYATEEKAAAIYNAAAWAEWGEFARLNEEVK